METAIRTPNSTSPIRLALKQKMNVMRAVMLRDMRTRFFNHGLGFLVVSFWPLAHLLILIVINSAAGRLAPFGDTLSVFLTTGLIPTLAFMYVSRFMAMSLILNRPMMSFPVVTMLDILFARAILEVLSAFLTLFFALIILWALGNQVFPYDPVQAIYAYITVLVLAVGVGTLAGVITMFFEFFITIYFLAMILVYIASGTLFVLSFLPNSVASALSWNPVLLCVEWMRSAYFPTFDNRYVDKSYVVIFALGSLCLGLLLERLLRRKVLEG